MERKGPSAEPPKPPEHPPLGRGCDAVPDPLRADVEAYWQTLTGTAPAIARSLAGRPGRMADICRVWASSDFVARQCARRPQLLEDLSQGDLEREYPAGAYDERVAAALADSLDGSGLKAALRQLRHREMVRIAWRDLVGWADLEETMRDLTGLAEACIRAALDRLHRWQEQELGTPRSRDGEPQRLVVLAMGKLGAGELNFSSDVDLIFTYPEEGETDGGRSVSNERFFTRLGRELIATLQDATADGFVCRVDMRLRPYGDSGALVSSFEAMEEYYQAQGREWERYAMVKARPITGDAAQRRRLESMLEPFVYRRYLDYGAFESLRDMKALIASEVARKGLEDNIKLGRGGIREVEFIGQAFQLIRGGREPRLRERGLLPVLERLSGLGYLPEHVSRELRTAYVFLRRLENRIQARDDQQTHQLPAESDDQLRLAFAMDYPDWDSLCHELDQHRDAVRGHFEHVIAAPQAEGAQEPRDEDDAAELSAVWDGSVDDDTARAALASVGFAEPEVALHLVQALREGHACRSLSAHGHRRLGRLMPLLTAAAGGTDVPETCLRRLTAVVDAMARRTAYLALLVENPMALSQLVKLCAASPWIADQIRRHPVLLDELLDPRTLYAPLDPSGLRQELEHQLAPVDADDLEQQMEVLRRFKDAHVLRVAAAEVEGSTPLMVVSDHLTAIAEVVLGQVVHLAFGHLVARYGAPRRRDGAAAEPPGLAVVGYGKLGGFELGYGSDLDLVFLYDSALEGGQTDGAKSLENTVFFARLGQRIIHMLNTHTPSGILYEVDVRLRPSGASGLLVSGLDAFAEYQEQEAWTWEHQALVRARVVAGHRGLEGGFNRVRHRVLSKPRDAGELRREVCSMRERMRRELRGGPSGSFDLKQDAGGLADIEFLVQYAVLRYAHECPALTEWTDNIRLLETLAANDLMNAADAEALRDAYRAYRARIHRLTLQEAPLRVAGDDLQEERQRVSAIWRAWLDPEAGGD